MEFPRAKREEETREEYEASLQVFVQQCVAREFPSQSTSAVQPTQAGQVEVASTSKAANSQKRKLSPDSATATSERALKFTKVSGFATTHGQDFEVVLAALLFLRGWNSGQQFQLATNVKGAGAMDDVVFRVKPQQEGSSWSTTFVQLKHKDSSWVNRSMLTNPKGDFSLAKYFKSYLEIKQAMSTTGSRAVLFDGDFKDCQFVIFTNAKADAKLVGGRSGEISQAEKFLWCGSGNVFSFETDKEILQCLGHEGGEFLSRLRLFCDQPSVMELAAAVKKQIASLFNVEVGGLNIGRLCDCYVSNVKVWWESSNEILHQDHDILHAALRKVRLESCSDQTLRDYKLELDFEEAALLDFKMQLVQLNSSMVHIVSSESSCKLTLTKLVQSSEVQPLVLSVQQLSANQQALFAEAKNRDSKSLIVVTKEWLSVQIDVIDEMLESLRNTFSIVILSDGNSSIGSQLSKMFPGRFESCNDSFTTSQLKPSSRDALLNKVVTLQGHETILAKLLDNNYECLDQVLTASLVVDILESVVRLTVGQALPEGIGYYVERTLEQPCVKTRVFQALQGHCVTVLITESEASDNGFFDEALYFLNLIDGSPSFNQGDKEDIINQLVQSLLVPDSDDYEVFIGPNFPLRLYECNCVGLRNKGQEKQVTAVCVVPGKEAPQQVSFLLVSSKTNEEDVKMVSEFHQSNNWFSLKAGQLRWVRSDQDIESIRKHIDQDQVSRFAPRTAMDVEDRLVLVCAEPGMGKSTLMARLAKNTKAAFPHYFVILIALNNHSKLFAEDKHTDALDFLSIVAKMDSPFQKSFLKFALEVSGNVVVIADGFDEIAPRYVKQCCHLLSKLLEETKARKIWMTSRNSVKQTIETHFSKFSAKLGEFDKDGQKKFFQTFWGKKSKLMEIDLDKLIDDLLDKSSKAIRDKEQNFLGIPLQCQMLAEVFEDHVNGSAKNAKLPDKLDLFSLLEMFVDKKCNVYVENKLGIQPESAIYDDQCKKEKKQFIDRHSKAGLVLILGEDGLKTLQGMEHIINDLVAFCKEIQLGKDKTGFVDEIVNDKPRFIHRVFAEYFVANWISQHLAESAELIKSKMFTADFAVIRHIFNGILCKGLVLHTAVLQENADEVKNLLESKTVDVEAQDVGGRTALHLAASLGASEDKRETRRRCEILDLIIGKTTDFKVFDKVLFGSPLRYADITRWWTAIDKLLCKTDDNGQLIMTLEDVRDENMQVTILDQDLDKLLELCLDNGLAVEHRYEGKFRGERRLLVRACRKGSVKVANLLIERNANIFIESNIEEPLHGTYEYQNKSTGPLMSASSNGHLEVVRLLVEKYVSTLASPLHCGVPDNETNHPNASQYINVKDTDGRTAIHHAAEKGHTDVITYLLSQGGDLLSPDRNNETPLNCAAKGGHWITIRVLLEPLSEADRVAVVHSLDNHGNYALTSVARKGLMECLKLLIDNGAKLYQVGCDEETTLMTAAKGGRQELLKWLLDNFNEEREGISLVEYINMRKKYGNSAMNYAGLGGFVECLKLLLDNGGKLYQVGCDKETVLMTAASCGRKEVVKWLLDNFNKEREGISLVEYINMKNKFGKTAMNHAAFQGSVECLKLLFDNGGKLYQVGCDNETTLLTAARGDNQEVVKWLLDNFHEGREGISLVEYINIKNKFGKTALDRARWQCLEVIEKILK